MILGGILSFPIVKFKKVYLAVTVAVAAKIRNARRSPAAKKYKYSIVFCAKDGLHLPKRRFAL